MFTMIPEDYLTTGVVPICIRQVDNEGNEVFPGWIEAVPPIADPLRRLARFAIGRRISSRTIRPARARSWPSTQFGHLSGCHLESAGYDRGRPPRAQRS